MRAPLSPLVFLAILAASCGGDTTEGSLGTACGEREALVGGQCICLPDHYGEGCAPCDCPQGTYCADGRSGDGSCLEPAIVCGEREALAGGHCICLPGHYGDDCTPCDCSEGTYCADGKKGDGSC